MEWVIRARSSVLAVVSLVNMNEMRQINLVMGHDNMFFRGITSDPGHREIRLPCRMISSSHILLPQIEIMDHSNSPSLWNSGNTKNDHYITTVNTKAFNREYQV